MSTPISRINYRNSEKNSDFEIIGIREFFDTRPHDHLQRDYRLNFWIIMYITEGCGSHFVDFQEYCYKAGDVIFVQKNQVHRFLVNDQVDGYLIHLNEPFFYRIEGFNGDIFLEFVDKAYGSSMLTVDMSRDSTGRVLMKLMYKEYLKTGQALNLELIASLFQCFILDMRKQSDSDLKMFHSKDYENFKLYRQLVEENYKVLRSVKEYAKMMNLSKKTVNQATRRVAGLSAKQFIINRVVLEIKRYLSQGELMNYEIADELGFVEAANMTKFFKHYEGVSPKNFRETP